MPIDYLVPRSDTTDDDVGPVANDRWKEFGVST